MIHCILFCVVVVGYCIFAIIMGAAQNAGK